MQDRYSGDVGDFAKLGLLRQLIQPCCLGSPLRIGVLWYLTENESGNLDGKHTSYLRDDMLGSCDPELREALRAIITAEDRRVKRLQDLLAPDRSSFFSERLPSANGLHEGSLCRMAARRQWFSEALKATSTADLVFMDPDNGLEVNSVPFSSAKANKYVYEHELKAVVARSQSVLLYQHHNRQLPAEKQVRFTMERLRAIVQDGQPVIGITFRKGSIRSFYLIAAKAHSEILQYHLRALNDGPWAAYLRFTGWRGELCHASRIWCHDE
jgi:hypothetical protein